MALSTGRDGREYAHRHMPAVKTGDGPWGDAIRYWLPRKNMRQADLARETGIDEKTISSMARGFHTTTRKLAEVAHAFAVPLEDVLISPDRQSQRDRTADTITRAVAQALEEHERTRARPPTLDRIMTDIGTVADQKDARRTRDEKRKTVRRLRKK